MDRHDKIAIFGASGLIGSEIEAQLRADGYDNLLTPSHHVLDLTDQSAVGVFMRNENPDYVFFCAVRTITNFDAEGVIDAVELYSNITMQCNVIEACRLQNIKKAVFLGSAMLYPWTRKHQHELLKEEILEEFDINKYRASMRSTVLGKYVGMKLCQYYNSQYGTMYIYAIPTHIYGGFKNRKNLYFLENMVSNICDAYSHGDDELYLDVFGKGIALKQFLHVSDCANAIIKVMRCYDDAMCPINISSNEPESWSSIVNMVSDIVGYSGTIRFNSERKEDMTNRICSIERLNGIGWKQSISMREGLELLVKEYKSMKGIG